jgi:hypothetical protein
MADTTGRTIQTHEWYQDLLGAYALGTLLPDEAAALEEHLATCPTCPAELRQLRLGVQAYALVAEERDPSPQLRDRLWAAISTVPAADVVTPRDKEDESARMEDEGGPAADSSEAYPAEPPDTDVQDEADSIGATPIGRPFQRPDLLSRDEERSARNVAISPYWMRIAAALAVILIGSLIAWNVSLRGDDQGDDGTVLGQFATTADAPDPTSGGEVRYVKDKDLLLISMHDLPALGEGEVYQLWLLQGDTVSPSVTFEPSPVAGEETLVAVVANPDQFDTLAITREPGPIGSTAPTTNPILVAQV